MEELSFAINGRHMAALALGDPAGRPLLALHGWLDNAESFVPLAQSLPGFRVLALDLAGHGRSDHRSADREYGIWNDLPDILAVADQLGWKQFVLLGHSRGAIVSSLLAAAMPERVSHLLLLDALTTASAPAEDCAKQLGQFLLDRQRLLERTPRVFETVEEAVALRARGEIGPAAAEAIARRNLRANGDGWSWTTDQRLLGASAFKLTDAHNAAIMSALNMPTLVLLAEQGLMAQHGMETGLPQEILPGGHHFHMEESVFAIAQRIVEFVSAE